MMLYKENFQQKNIYTNFMNEDFLIINENARKEKIKIFFVKNKKKIYLLIFLICFILFSIFFYRDYNDKKYQKLAERFDLVLLNFNKNNKGDFNVKLKDIIYENNKTYSPLALFFLIDNKIYNSIDEANKLFDIVINISSIDKEIKNLLIYKKGLFNSEKISESEIMDILNPVINSKSIWRPQTLMLLGDYFLSRNEKNKAKEFFSEILLDKNSTENLILQAQKKIRINFGN